MANTLNQFEELSGSTVEEWIEDGGLASEFTKRYYKWNENPEAFYETLPTPYPSIYEEFATEQQNSQALPEVNAEIDRIERQVEEKDKTKSGYFKIGTVELEIPPIQITVNDIKQNYMYQTLRAKSDIIMESGHGTKIIELDMYFHDIDDINNKLRPLLAQLKCSPFIPIYSDYLEKALFPDGEKHVKTSDKDNKEENLSQKLKELDGKIFLTKDKLRTVIRKNDKLMLAKPNLLEDLNDYWDYELNPFNSSKLDQKKSLTENIDFILTEAGVYENAVDTSSIKYQAAMTDVDIDNYKSQKVSNFNEIDGESAQNGNLVGVLSQINVGTVAGFSESLACHATFFLFNYYPFSTKFEVLDKNNNPTLDIDECLYFVQFYTSRFLMPKDDSDRYFQPLARSMDGKVSFRYDIKGEALDENRKKVGKDLPLYIETNSDSVCAAVTITQKNSISFLPVLEHSFPTCQYLGAQNAQIIITIDTIDDTFIDGIKYIFDTADSYTRSNVKARRRNYVYIENELVSLFGIKRCILNNISTATVEGSPGMSRIQISLVEFNAKQLEEEEIVRYQDVSEEKLLEYFKADVQSYLDNPNSSALADTLSKNDIYARAAGYSESFRSISDPDSWVQFKPDEARMDDLKATIKDTGLYVTEVKQRSLPTAYAIPVIGGSAITRRGTQVFVKYDKREDQVPYGSVQKEKVAKYMRGVVNNATRVEDIPDHIVRGLYNTNDMNEYFNKSRNKIKNYAGGNSRALPANVLDRFEEKNLTNLYDVAISTYPDLDLPTYSDTKKVGKGAPKPSYLTLGTRNPAGDPNATPRVDSDIVEADFYFYYEPLSRVSGKINGSQSFDYKKNIMQAKQIYAEEYTRGVLVDLEKFLKVSIKPADKPIRKIPVDGMLEDEGEAIVDELVRTSKEKAEKLRNSIEGISPTTTTSEDFDKYTRIRDDVYNATEEEVQWAKEQADLKTFSNIQVEVVDDSGKNIYSGIAPDASVFEVSTVSEGTKTVDVEKIKEEVHEQLVNKNVTGKVTPAAVSVPSVIPEISEEEIKRLLLEEERLGLITTVAPPIVGAF